eukprot:3824264-Prymnesium_polylepis.1
MRRARRALRDELPHAAATSFRRASGAPGSLQWLPGRQRPSFRAYPESADSYSGLLPRQQQTMDRV